MRIIAGTYRRRNIRAPKGNTTRPSTDRTRESLFNMIEARIDLDDADVLDLFAGTGALGLEAISRGAAAATFVEFDATSLKFARQNAADLSVENVCFFLRSDAISYIQRYNGPPFDLILADPPYELEQIPKMPELALAHLKPDGLFALEHDARHSFAGHPNLRVARAYGRTIVSIFGPAEQDD